jgi:hypothetical protein
MSQSPVRPPEPLIAPAVEARIREIIRDELHRHIITTEVTIEIAPTTVLRRRRISALWQVLGTLKPSVNQNRTRVP